MRTWTVLQRGKDNEVIVCEGSKGLMADYGRPTVGASIGIAWRETQEEGGAREDGMRAHSHDARAQTVEERLR